MEELLNRCCDRDEKWHAQRRKNYGYAHSEEIDPPIPFMSNTPAPIEVVEKFKSMSESELLSHCEDLLVGKNKHIGEALLLGVIGQGLR